MRKCGIIVAMLVLIGCMWCGEASADVGLSAQGVIGVFSEEDGRQLALLDSSSATLGQEPPGAYFAFCFSLTNQGADTADCRDVYVRIDGGEKLSWADFKLASGQSIVLPVYAHHMKKLTAGIYRVELYINGKEAATQYFMLRRDWALTAELPSQAQIDALIRREGAPYLCCMPDVSGTQGFIAYSVDFRMDHLPAGTFLAPCNWFFDQSELKKQYVQVDDQGVSGYCGLQVLDDGRHVAIMSLWDVYCYDSAGRRTTFRGKLIYPEHGMTDDVFDGEGSGVHCLVPFDWEEGRFYRLLLQQSRVEENGNTSMILWIRDMESRTWTKLIEYDTGLKDVWMTGAVAFLEDFSNNNAGPVRSAELANFRVQTRGGEWTPIKKAQVYLGFEHPGSYTFGTDGRSFWMLSTGVEGVWKKPPAIQTLRVSYAESGNPLR